MARALTLAEARPAPHAPEPLGRLRPRRRRHRGGGGRDRPAGRRRTPRPPPSPPPGTAPRAPPRYVTLEPCAHQGRTGPCADALIAAGVRRRRRRDRGPRPPGRRARASPRCAPAASTSRSGSARPRSAAPSPRTSTSAAPAGRSASPRWPVSVDGRTAAPDGTSRWITGRAARADAHEPPRRLAGRRRSAPAPRSTDRPAADRPRRRGAGPHPPLRVVLDARGRVPATGPLFDPSLAPTLVITTAAAPPDRVDAWQAAGAKVEVVDARPGRRRPRRGAHRARPPRRPPGARRGRRGPARGACGAPGSSTGSSCTSAPRCSAPTAHPTLDMAGPATIADAARLDPPDVTVLDDDVRLTYDAGREPADVHRHRRGAGPVRAPTTHRPAAPASRSPPTPCVADADDRRVDRGERLLPHRRRPRPTTGLHADVAPETLDAHHPRRPARRRPGQPRAARCASPTGSAATSSRATSTGSGPSPPAPRRGRVHPAHRPSPRRAGSLRRREGLGHRRRGQPHRHRRRRHEFSVALIPHTLAVTTLGARPPGDGGQPRDRHRRQVRRTARSSRSARRTTGDDRHVHRHREGHRRGAHEASSSSSSTTPTARTKAT